MGEAGCRPKMRQDVTTGEAGCHPKLRQDVAAHLFAHHKTACLLTLSPLACHEAACGEPVKRRFRAWSGRRGSNPRQPAWKAGTLPLSYSRVLFVNGILSVYLTGRGART